MEQDEIIIRQGIVHILDGELGCPVFSEQLLELSPDINDSSICVVPFTISPSTAILSPGRPIKISFNFISSIVTSL